MKRLKINLHSNLFYCFLFLCLFLYVVIRIHIPILSCYDEGNVIISGVIEKVVHYDDKTVYTIKSKEKILATYYNHEGDLKLGDVVRFFGEIKRPSSRSNFYLFDYQNYLKSLNIYRIMTVDKIEIINKNHSIFYNIKNRMIDRISNYNDSEYYMAFILGDSSGIDNSVMDSYQDNGISHLLAVSGMHIGLLSGVLLFLFKKIKINNKICYVIVIMILLFYMFLTGFTPSVIRAVSFFILLYINKYFHLGFTTIHVFLWICFFSLVLNPFYIYHVGFLFSYIVTFFLIVFGKNMNTYKNYFIKLLYISMIAFLAGFPIMCRNYFVVNFLSPFFNLFFVPFVSFLVFPLSFISFLFPVFSSLFHFMVEIMEEFSLFCSSITLFQIPFSYISIPFVFFYYGIILFVLFMINKKKYNYIWLLILIMFFHYHCSFFKNSYSIHVLDVGQGDSTLIVYPRKDYGVLIDTGGILSYKGKKNFYYGENVIIPYMRAIGLRKIKFLVLSHGDFDHMGESIALVNNIKVENVIFNCGEFNELELDLIKVLDKKKIPYYSCIKELNIDDNKLYFLNNKDYGNENDNSNVIYTELNGHKFMFMGDAGVKVEEDIIKKYNLQDIDVLKVGHHGSKTSSSKSFINEINPKYSIISVGKNNRYGHPNIEVLNNLSDSKIYRTDQHGSIMFKIKNNKLKIETCSP